MNLERKPKLRGRLAGSGGVILESEAGARKRGAAVGRWGKKTYFEREQLVRMVGACWFRGR